jgi:hypothetical protein
MPRTGRSEPAIPRSRDVSAPEEREDRFGSYGVNLEGDCGMRLYPWILRLAVLVILVLAAASGAGWKWTGPPMPS